MKIVHEIRTDECVIRVEVESEEANRQDLLWTFAQVLGIAMPELQQPNKMPAWVEV